MKSATQWEIKPPSRTVYIDDDDKVDLDREGATRAIIPQLLAPRVKFNITRTTIQLLHLKGLFAGLPGNDSNMNLVNFLTIYKSFYYLGVGQNAIRLWIFPLSLSGEATLWLNELDPNSITN